MCAERLPRTCGNKMKKLSPLAILTEENCRSLYKNIQTLLYTIKLKKKKVEQNKGIC